MITVDDIKLATTMSTNKNLSTLLPQARFMAGQARANTLARRQATNLFCALALQLICLALPNVLRGQTNVLQL